MFIDWFKIWFQISLQLVFFFDNYHQKKYLCYQTRMTTLKGRKAPNIINIGKGTKWVKNRGLEVVKMRERLRKKDMTYVRKSRNLNKWLYLLLHRPADCRTK